MIIKMVIFESSWMSPREQDNFSQWVAKHIWEWTSMLLALHKGMAYEVIWKKTIKLNIIKLVIVFSCLGYGSVTCNSIYKFMFSYDV